MPKEYKEIKLFNGMSMSLDANDIDESSAQITINTKDLANGKLDSDYTLNSSPLSSALVGGYKIKKINEVKDIFLKQLREISKKYRTCLKRVVC